MIIRLVLMLLLAFMQYQIWWTPQGYSHYQSLKQEREKQEKTNQQLAKKIESIEKDIQSKANNTQWIEAEARETYGMVKSDETFYVVQ